MMPLTLIEATAIASRAHAGQFDKNGSPYIAHPMAVAAMVDGEDAKIVAMWHDVLEDTTLTASDLRALGATKAQVDAIVALTRLPGEPYEIYVRRALRDPLGRVVKIADHDHNTDPVRLAMLPSHVADRLRRKYARVHDLIEAARSENATEEKG